LAVFLKMLVAVASSEEEWGTFLVALAKSHARNSTLLAEDHRLVGATGCLQPVLLRPRQERTG
jgi:hypothetical protein